MNHSPILKEFFDTILKVKSVKSTTSSPTFAYREKNAIYLLGVLFNRMFLEIESKATDVKKILFISYNSYSSLMINRKR
jgi:hypothetical protein